SAENGMSTPIRRICSPCCARAASGQATAALPSSVMKSRRLIGPTPGQASRTNYSRSLEQVGDVNRNKNTCKFPELAIACSRIRKKIRDGDDTTGALRGGGRLIPEVFLLRADELIE